MGQSLSLCDNELEHRCQRLDTHISKLNRDIDKLHADLTEARALNAGLRESETAWGTRYNNIHTKIETIFTDPITVESVFVKVDHIDLDDSFERRYIEAILKELWTLFTSE